MPSSSTRSTSLEVTLHGLFKETYTRLDTSSCPSEADFILDHFATLLDISVSDLLSTLTPRFTGSNHEDYKYELWLERQLKDEIAKKARSGNVYDAGLKLGRVGQELFSVGRDEEAREWCEWGEVLEGIGGEILAQEQAWAKGYGWS